jgi:hypothetical protein
MASQRIRSDIKMMSWKSTTQVEGNVGVGDMEKG